MGTFHSSLTLVGASGAIEEVEALVDTGSTFTTIPGPVLERLRVRPHRVIRLGLANGQLTERRLGRVLARFDGVEEEILCAFGDVGDLPTIGAHTLEAFLLAVDPVEQRLVPSEALWA